MLEPMAFCRRFWSGVGIILIILTARLIFDQRLKLRTSAMLIIPHQKLSPEALLGVIEEFVTRDGTAGIMDLLRLH